VDHSPVPLAVLLPHAFPDASSFRPGNTPSAG
jgi:hypothetical protein